MRIEYIIIHCSDSLWGCAREIRKWHLERGWNDIGYHWIILNGRVTQGLYIPSLDGSVECGRYFDEDSFIRGAEIGAHALGYNDKSIGICLIGKDEFTDNQIRALARLIYNLHEIYKIELDNVLGHCETMLAGGKTCPNFDVRAFREILKYEIEEKERYALSVW